MVIIVCSKQPLSSNDIYSLRRLLMSFNSWRLTYVNAILVRLTSSSPDIYHRCRLLYKSSSSLDIYSLHHLLSPFSPRTVLSSHRRCTESRPDSSHLPFDNLTSSTERRVTFQSWADVNIASHGPLPSSPSPSQTPFSSSGKTNYLHQSLPRDSSPQTSHFNCSRRVVLMYDRSVIKRDTIFIMNATCLLVNPSLRQQTALTFVIWLLL